MAASPRDNEETTLGETRRARHVGQVSRAGDLPEFDEFTVGLSGGVPLPGGAQDDAEDVDEIDPEHDEPGAGAGESDVEPQELRPQRKLRVWQLAPIVAFSALGSLMFAFPLAFEPGGSGAVVSMLGLLICGCAAGWGVMAARRVGLRWPGLPARGSGQRPDWRVVVLYAVVVGTVVMLAVWRVARLR